jgi:hypothetical protein
VPGIVWDDDCRPHGRHDHFAVTEPGTADPGGDRNTNVRSDKLKFFFTERARVSAARTRLALPSDGRYRRGSERGLVPAARFDELLSRAATVGVSVGHRAAQLLDA